MSTLGVVLALAVVILAVVNAYVVRALPYPAAARLYRVDYAASSRSAPRGMEQLDWSALNDIIELPLAWDLDVFYLLGHEYPESSPGGWVTPGICTASVYVRRLEGTFTDADFAGAHLQSRSSAIACGRRGSTALPTSSAARSMRA